MIIIDGESFNKLTAKKVILDLENCKLTIMCDFDNGKSRKSRFFLIDTDCDVNINHYIDKITKDLYDGIDIPHL